MYIILSCLVKLLRLVIAFVVAISIVNGSIIGSYDCHEREFRGEREESI